MDIKIFELALSSYILRVLLVITILLFSGFKQIFAQKNEFYNNEMIHNQLPNGFRYYIKPMKTEGTISMHFYVKAGQEMEDADQFQMAHLVEHMAFRNSENFPGGIYNADSLFASVGMQGIGRDVYAGSSVDYTHYIFNANVKDDKSIDMGLSWFQDIAGGLKLDNKDMTIEKGALKQEFELRSSGQLENLLNENRLYASLFPCKQSFYNYNKKVGILRLEAMMQFYKTWYVPGNMAVVIIGDIEQPKKLEDQIKTVFSGIKVSGQKKEKTACDSIYLHKPSQFVILEKQVVVDESAEEVEINFYYKDKLLLQDIRTSADALTRVKQKIKWELIISALGDQIDDLTEVYNPSFQHEVMNLIKYSPVSAASLVKISTSQNNLVPTLEKIFEKISQFSSYGLSSSKWEKLKIKKSQILKNQNPESISYWEEEIKSHFTGDEYLDIDKQELLTQWLSEMSLNDFNKTIKELIGKVPEDIGVIIANKENFPFQEKDIRELIQNKLNADIRPLKEPSNKKKIMKAETKEALVPTSFSIVPDSLLGERYRLANGLEIVLVPDTTFENKVAVHGFSPLGATNLPDADFYSATYSPGLVKHSGSGSLNKFELEKILEKYPDLVVTPYIKASETGIKGEALAQDIEVLMQLMHLYITDPRMDPNAYSDWKRISKMSVVNPSYGPANTNFNNMIKEYLGVNKIYFSMGNHHLRDMENVEFAKAIDSYKELFSVSDQFTYIISGDFKVDAILEYAQKYLGTLPNNSRRLISNVSKKQKNTIGKAPKAHKVVLKSFSKRENTMYSIRYLGKQENYDWQKDIKIQFLGEILGEHAWKLRLEKGFSLYYVFSRGEFDKDLNRYELSLKVDGVPSEIEALKKECEAIIDNLKEGKISQKTFDKVFNRFIKKWSSESKNPKQSVKKLYHYYSNKDRVFLGSNEIIEYLTSIKLKNMKQFAKEFMIKKNRYEFIM